MVPRDENGTFHWDGPPTIDNTIGRVWVGLFLEPGTFFNGNGTLLIINFTAKQPGNVTLHLYETEIYDKWSDPYMHDTFDGVVQVLPEFATLIWGTL